jgi:LemA protein
MMAENFNISRGYLLGEQVPVGLIVVTVIILVPMIWLVATINRFVRLGTLIRESWANVDVVLKRRYDLIPNLVETVRGYAKHEREVLAEVIAARDQAVASPRSRPSRPGTRTGWCTA